MFHPVGSQPSSVYWRRRLVFAGSFVLLIVLLVVTVHTVAGGDGKQLAAASTTPTASARSTPPNSPSPSRRPASHTSKSSASHRPSTSAGSGSPSSSGSQTAAPVDCIASQLAVTAVAAATTYQVGDKPVVELQVTNKGPLPCVQDLADKQVELKIYNGESRVWGSHDCAVQPGTNRRTLAVGSPVRVSITWLGLTSRPGCKGTRQRVGAGTYTLYASLSGHTGTATQFSIT